jgi:hypothetical protein
VGFVGPNARSASVGAAALTGASAPGGAVGLIYAAQKAIVTKTFGGKGGTTDLNLPLEILPLLRFGLHGKNNLPRAEFDLDVRYLDQQGLEVASAPRRAGDGNVTYYGVGPIASAKPGHRDVRMLIPSVARDLARDVSNAGLLLPAIGDYLLLEFPTLAQPRLRLSILDPNSTLHTQVARIANATPNVGHGNAWWLPSGVSPAW